MAGMTKREAKKLAGEFVSLRPRIPAHVEYPEEVKERLESLWREMVERTATHLPSDIGPVFREVVLVKNGMWPIGR